VIGVGSSAAWAGLVALFRRVPKKHLSLTYVDLEDDKGNRGRAIKAEGDSESVLAALDKVIGKSPPAEINSAAEDQGGSESPPIEFPEAGSDQCQHRHKTDPLPPVEN
jgi:hypothetical protein